MNDSENDQGSAAADQASQSLGCCKWVDDNGDPQCEDDFTAAKCASIGGNFFPGQRCP